MKHRTPTMKHRAYRPGTDGDGLRDKPRFRLSGSTFEPAHRQLIRVKIKPSGRWETAAYNRDWRSFYLKLPEGWLDVGADPIECWHQMPPKPRDGLSADQVVKTLRQ